MDQYLPNVARRIQMVQTQIEECQTMIYRNNIEDLTFKANNDKHKQTEVQTNNTILKEKIDLLTKELDSLNEAGGGVTEPGAAV